MQWNRHWALHIWIILGTKFQLKLTILIFWTKFLKKCISGMKQKNHSFASVYSRYLYYIKLFRMGANRHNSILMSLLLLITETIMNQTWENGKKLNFGLDFGLIGPNFCAKIFLWVLLILVVIVPSYHSMQFKGKLMNQTWENGKKTDSGTNFDLFVPNLGPQFFLWVLPLLVVCLYIIASYNCVIFQGKLMSKMLENGKKTSFGFDFGPFGRNLGPNIF